MEKKNNVKSKPSFKKKSQPNPNSKPKDSPKLDETSGPFVRKQSLTPIMPLKPMLTNKSDLKNSVMSKIEEKSDSNLSSNPRR